MKCNCRYENQETFCQNRGTFNDTQTNVPYQPGRQKPYQNASEEKPKSAVVWVVLPLFISDSLFDHGHRWWLLLFLLARQGLGFRPNWNWTRRSLLSQ